MDQVPVLSFKRTLNQSGPGSKVKQERKVAAEWLRACDCAKEVQVQEQRVCIHVSGGGTHVLKAAPDARLDVAAPERCHLSELPWDLDGIM